jgi:predicted nucleic acid-binding protein
MDAAIWSDDSDFVDQELVETYTTSEVLNSFETR